VKKSAHSSTAAASATDGPRVIKKYPNRRLYDTQSSSYVTLAEVRDLVMKHERFAVVDAKTGEDVTRAMLLQIILEAETGAGPMFSEAALANMIRMHGMAAQGPMGQLIESNLQSMLSMHDKMQTLSPLNTMARMSQQLQSQSEQWMAAWTSARPDRK
jgi:polyhydroxyalkanoate synthesis repressor PhaR